MSIIAPFLSFLLVGAFAAYHRLRLAYWAAITITALVACWLLGANPAATIVAAALVALIAVPLLIPGLRKPLVTAPLLKFFRKVLPPLSQTERIALETGSVGFEGELFTGDPDWQTLLNYPKPQLTAEEQAFLDGPVEEFQSLVPHARHVHLPHATHMLAGDDNDTFTKTVLQYLAELPAASATSTNLSTTGDSAVTTPDTGASA